MSMFKKHRKSVDHILSALCSLSEGKHNAAAKSLQLAMESEDFIPAMEEMDEANSESMEEESSFKSARSKLAAALVKAAEEVQEIELTEQPSEEASDDDDGAELDSEEAEGEDENEGEELSSIRKSVEARSKRTKANLAKLGKK